MNHNSHVLALSFDCPSMPRIYPRPMSIVGSWAQITHGWGIAWYPKDNNSAAIVKNALSLEDTMSSTTFVSFTEKGHGEAPLKDIQPFIRPYDGKDWIWCSHPHLIASQTEFKIPLLPAFKPIGSTLSELSFCSFLHLLNKFGAGSIRSASLEILEEILSQIIYMNQQIVSQTQNMILTDGDSLFIYRGSDLDMPLYIYRVCHPYGDVHYNKGALMLAITDPLDATKTMCAVSSTPLSDDPWLAIEPNLILIIRKGQVVVERPFKPKESQPKMELISTPEHEEGIKFLERGAEFVQQSKHQHYRQHPQLLKLMDSSKIKRKLALTHQTIYTYSNYVEYSTHTLKLRPSHGEGQNLVDYKFTLSEDVELLKYEDVFGNYAMHFTLNHSYQKLEILSEAVVDIHPRYIDFSLPLRQFSIPLFWTPWQRQMMSPYLLPVELPETELQELSDYAMSFVERNHYHLLETILNINDTIFSDYKYISGSTTLQTTAYQVFSMRQGVCQDFANLFICLARLLNIPARYRAGYIYAGKNYDNKIQSDATHAWVELYLPYIGWMGFDPTNGALVGEDHILVACGRNYIDATPTGGTIYKGGGEESLHVHVHVKEI